MPFNKKFSSFQNTLLKIARERLNLMLSEVCQLKGEVDFSNKAALTREVLLQIASGKVKSVHISKQEASNFLHFIEELGSHQKLYCAFDESSNEAVKEEEEPSANNPYLDSPF